MKTRTSKLVAKKDIKIAKFARLLIFGLSCAASLLVPTEAKAEAKFIKKIPWAEQGQWIKADTHIHTKLSDGSHTIAEIASKAVEHGCDVIAITDHSDRELKGASIEYEREILAARRIFPNLIILSGIEWNIPPWKGEQHVSLLLSPGPDEFLILREFKHKFDDYEREERVPDLAHQALKWLESTTSQSDSEPVLFLNHPSRKLNQTDDIQEMFKTWRSTNNLIVGIEGGPGHQKGEPIGSYKGILKPIDRWDPSVAMNGNAWDQLLSQGHDVWGAIATSDFHSPSYDYWPGEFAETWLYVPERSALGAIAALRQGSFFATHGHIVRKASLSAWATGLDRPAYPGETISVPEGETILLKLECEIPNNDWSGARNYLDQLTIVKIQNNEVDALVEERISIENAILENGISVPPGGLVLRAFGRSSKLDGDNLFFYSNPIRVETTSPWFEGKQTEFPIQAAYWIVGTIIFIALFIALIRRPPIDNFKSPSQKRSPPQTPTTRHHSRNSGGVEPLGEVDWTPPAFPSLRQELLEKKKTNLPEAIESQVEKESKDHFKSTGQTTLWLEDHWYSPYLKHAYTTLVILVACAYAYVMLTQEPIVDTHGIPKKWSPPGIFVTTVISAITVLIYVPRSPLIGILSFFAINFFFPRYYPENAYLYWLRIPESISALISLGLILSDNFLTQYRTVRKSKIYISIICFIAWSTLCSVIAQTTTQVPPDDRHYPLRLINIFVLATTSATISWNAKRYLIFAGTCGTALAARSYYFPESVHLDGDLGYLLAGVIPIVAAAILLPMEWKYRTYFIALSGALVIAFYKSQNRAAAIGLLSAAFTAWIFSSRKLISTAITLPILIAIALLCSNGEFSSRFKDLYEQGVYSGTSGTRIEIWSTLPKLLDGKLLFGVGAGRFTNLIGSIDPNHREDPAHNIFIGVLAENGIPGFVLYLAIFTSSIAWYITNYYRLNLRSIQKNTIGVASGLAGLVVAGQFMTRHDSPLQFCLIGMIISWSQSLRSHHTLQENACPQSNTPAVSKQLNKHTPQTTSPPGNRVITSMFILFLTFATYGSLVPLDYTPLTFEIALDRFTNVLNADLDFSSRTDWTTNILLFVPIGFFGLGALAVNQGRKRAAILSPVVALNCVIISLLLEFSQHWFPTRTPSLNDIVGESIGGAIGILIWLSVGQRIVIYFRTLLKLNTKEDRITWLLSGYFVALLVYSLFPFDLTIRPSEIFDKYKDGRVELIPFSALSLPLESRLYSLFVESILFVPLGILLERFWIKSISTHISLMQLSIYAICLCLAIEISQLFVVSRFTSITDVTTGVLGILMGSQIHRFLEKNVPKNRKTAQSKRGIFFFACVGYSATLCILFWYPYNFTHNTAFTQERIEDFISVPFSRLLQGNYIQSLWSIARKFLWFSPLGFLTYRFTSTCQIENRSHHYVVPATLLYLFVFSLLVEFLQIFLPNHSADAFDFLIYLGGVSSGWMLASFITGKTKLTPY